MTLIRITTNMFFKLMSGEILSLSLDDNTPDSFIDQLEQILQVPRFRIHIETIDKENSNVFIKDHPHKIKRLYGGISEGFVNGVRGEYENYLLRIYRKNDNIKSISEWVLQYDIYYYFEPFQNKFLIKKDVTVHYDDLTGDHYITASKSYDTLIDTISNIEHTMKSDTFNYLLDEIHTLPTLKNLL